MPVGGTNLYTGYMSPSLYKAKKMLSENGPRIVGVAVAAWVAVFTAITLWKYAIFAYNAIDLAYFNQVFWNTLNGHFFQQSIHPHLSLGDHAELAILPLIPLYALHPDPRTLLFLQTAALALPAIPIFMIAKRRFGNYHSAFLRAALPIVLALAWLANPSVQNIALFEFHLLAFAILPLFLAALAYDQGKKFWFLAFSLAALLVREDVGMVIAAFGLVAWSERRPMWWRVVPLLMGTTWFFGAIKLVSLFSPGGSYKFLIYYSWLGDSFLGIIVGALRHPVPLLAHVLTLQNLEMFLGFLMPLLFFPLIRPKRLLLAIGPLLQIVLGAPGGGELILQTHYASLFLPAVFLAGIEGIRGLPPLMKRIRQQRATENVRFSLVVFAVAVLYSAAVMGPLMPVARRISDGAEDRERVAAAERMLSHIPTTAAVAASYDLLPRLSSRERLYSLHYHFLGVTQFAETEYTLPDDTRFIAYDTADLLKYQTQFPITAWAADRYDGGYGRLRAVTAEPLFAEGPIRLYAYAREPSEALAWSRPPVPSDGPHASSPSAVVREDAQTGLPELDAHLTWSSSVPVDEDLVVRVRIADGSGTALEREYPFADGLWSAKELGGRAIRQTFTIPLAQLPNGTYSPSISLERRKGFLAVSGIRSTEINVDESETVLTVPLQPFSLER